MLPENIRSAQFEDSYYPVIDGVVQVVHNYASIMNQISYSCVVCPESAIEFDDAALPYDVFRTPSFTSSAWQYSVANPLSRSMDNVIAEKARPDILHVHSPFSQRTSALRLARTLHVPLVTTFHTKYYDDVFRMTHSPVIARAVVANIVNFYNRCDSVWACSEGAARTLRQYGYKGDITVMVNGTAYEMPENADELRIQAASHFHITDDTHNLLFVGTQVWQKNIRLALDTMKLLCEGGSAGGERPDSKSRSACEGGSACEYRLLIAGCGHDEEAIKAYAKSLGLTDQQVSFLGLITDRDLLSGLFLNADLFFFPSVYDTSALVLREASILGTPSLLTAGSNAADVITPDVNGFVAEETPEAMAAKILSVIDDKALLHAVGHTAGETIPVKWTDLIPRVYEKYAEVIEKYNMKRLTAK